MDYQLRVHIGYIENSHLNHFAVSKINLRVTIRCIPYFFSKHSQIFYHNLRITSGPIVDSSIYERDSSSYAISDYVHAGF